MIDFRPISLADKETYEKLKSEDSSRGCEMSFANLFLWGNQKVAIVDNQMCFLATFSRSVYPFPVGGGDKKIALDAIINDAKERGFPLEITAVCEREKEILQELYPDSFEFSSNIDSFDYVYNIDDLADLLGKKYHKKRNHLNNFIKNHPDYRVEPISKDNMDKVVDMVGKWYSEREGDFDYEKIVFNRAVKDFEKLGLVGLVLLDGEEVLAVTFASKMLEDTFDVHFEKANAKIDGAYTAINYEFARYIRNNYPEIKFLDREEDMGLAGLRKAKQSYYPHHQVVKYKAKLK